MSIVRKRMCCTFTFLLKATIVIPSVATLLELKSSSMSDALWETDVKVQFYLWHIQICCVTKNTHTLSSRTETRKQLWPQVRLYDINLQRIMWNMWRGNSTLSSSHIYTLQNRQTPPSLNFHNHYTSLRSNHGYNSSLSTLVNPTGCGMYITSLKEEPISK